MFVSDGKNLCRLCVSCVLYGEWWLNIGVMWLCYENVLLFLLSISCLLVVVW